MALGTFIKAKSFKNAIVSALQHFLETYVQHEDFTLIKTILIFYAPVSKFYKLH